jgi:hypothetical protein
MAFGLASGFDQKISEPWVLLTSCSNAFSGILPYLSVFFHLLKGFLGITEQTSSDLW